MASKARILYDAPGAIVVRVDHLDTDSFTRSVDPTATRMVNKAVHRRTVTHVKGMYACNSVGRKCVSAIAYGTSFRNAEALLESWYVSSGELNVE